MNSYVQCWLTAAFRGQDGSRLCVSSLNCCLLWQIFVAQMLLNVSCVCGVYLTAVKHAYRAALVLPNFLILGPLLFLTTINYSCTN
jgi:hypothetical protein